MANILRQDADGVPYLVRAIKSFITSSPSIEAQVRATLAKTLDDLQAASKNSQEDALRILQQRLAEPLVKKDPLADYSFMHFMVSLGFILMAYAFYLVTPGLIGIAGRWYEKKYPERDIPAWLRWCINRWEEERLDMIAAEEDRVDRRRARAVENKAAEEKAAEKENATEQYGGENSTTTDKLLEEFHVVEAGA
jgi:hypothetical protein